MQGNAKIIQSVQRAIDILNCFTIERPSLSIHDISHQTGLNVNTARGLINTLIANKLIIYNKATSLYALGTYFYAKTSITKETIAHYIKMFKYLVDEFANKYHLTSSLQLVQQDEIQSIYCAYPQNTAYYITLLENTSLPIHATSSGKLLLAHNASEVVVRSLTLPCFTPFTCCQTEQLLAELTKVRQQGYATEVDEFSPGVASIAVPIFDATGSLIATISTTLFSQALQPIKKELLSDLRIIAQKIMTDLE